MAGFAAHNNTLKMAESQQLETTISTDQSLSVLCSPLLRVRLLIDATHALLTYALVVSVNTGAAEYTFTAQQLLYLLYISVTLSLCKCVFNDRSIKSI